MEVQTSATNDQPNLIKAKEETCWQSVDEFLARSNFIILSYLILDFKHIWESN